MHFPGFLHNLFHWGLTHAEGVAKGAADDARFEANPVVLSALQAAEDAGRAVLVQHVAKMTGIPPTPEGLAGLVADVIDGRLTVPASAKEPLKLLIGGLAGVAAPFLASAEGTLARDAASKDAASKDAASAVGEKAAGGPDVSKNNLSGVSGVLVDAGGVKTVLNSGEGQNQTGLDIDPNRFNADGTPKDPLATGGLA